MSQVYVFNHKYHNDYLVGSAKEFACISTELADIVKAMRNVICEYTDDDEVTVSIFEVDGAIRPIRKMKPIALPSKYRPLTVQETFGDVKEEHLCENLLLFVCMNYTIDENGYCTYRAFAVASSLTNAITKLILFSVKRIEKKKETTMDFGGFEIHKFDLHESGTRATQHLTVLLDARKLIAHKYSRDVQDTAWIKDHLQELSDDFLAYAKNREG